MLLNRRAQTTVEYAVLAAVVVGALALMYGYLRQSAMGRLKSTGDQIGEQLTPGATYTVTSDVTRREVTTPSGVATSTIEGEEVQERKQQ